MPDQSHWEKIYSTKKLNEVSWTQKKPVVSLQFLESITNQNRSIIDVGGGSSNLVDFLIENPWDITVLDISKTALSNTKQRIPNSSKVKWIEADVLTYAFDKDYTVWHDRACFHFLTENKEIEQYKQQVFKTNPSYIVIGTFSTNGPLKCSGLPITQYDHNSLYSIFKENYTLVKHEYQAHQTPFETSQNFVFVLLKRKG